MHILNDPDGKLKEFEDQINSMVLTRHEVVRLRAAADELEEDANNLFQMISQVCKVEKVETDLGTYKLVKRSGSNKLDQQKLKDHLLKKGVASDLLVEAFKVSTTKGKGSEYPAFFMPGVDK